MIKLIWAVLCERVITDQVTGLASYLNCMETIGAAKFPVDVQALALGTRWHFETESELHLKFRLVLVCPDGSEQVVMASDVNTRSKANNHRINFVLNGFRFDQAGHYVLSLQSGSDRSWAVAQEIPFDVALVTPEGKSKPIKKRAKKI